MTVEFKLKIKAKRVIARENRRWGIAGLWVGFGA